MDLLSKNTGDRIQPISEYQEKFGVSRGTVQNAFTYLKECGAVVLEHHGHQGTYIEKLDYHKLQENCMRKELLGIMPLPYSLTYEGFATAIYSELDELNFNMASKHVLLLADESKDGICDGMKVAYDSKSLDQSRITDNIVKGKKITLIPIRTQQTIGALIDGTIDAGVWNYDDVLENHHDRLKVVSLAETDYNNSFSTAVLVIKTGDEALKALLKKYISVERVLGILSEVREKRREPFF